MKNWNKTHHFSLYFVNIINIKKRTNKWNKTQQNFQFGNYKIEIDDKKLFLDAYKKVLIKNEKNARKNLNNRNKKWIEYKYHHPGVFREFKYKVKGDPQKEEKFMAWSCCNNTNKNAKGCQKVKIDKHKWNFDSA